MGDEYWREVGRVNHVAGRVVKDRMVFVLTFSRVAKLTAFLEAVEAGVAVVPATRSLAEIATDHLHKGSRIHIEGRLKSRSWEDEDGNRHFLTEIVVSDLQILDGSGNGPAELDLLYGRDQLHSSEQATAALASAVGARHDGPSIAAEEDGLPF